MDTRDDAEQRIRIRAGRLALLAGTAIFLGKFAVYTLTGSSAVFSDAMESVVNVAAAAMLLWAIVVAARPPDPDHPYGHGKVEFFSAAVEGGLVAVAAMAILIEAVGELVRGPQLRQLEIGLLLLAVLSGANAALGVYLLRTGRRTGSLALVADGRHVLTDVWTSLGVLVGLGLVRLTGWLWLDPLVAIAVAVNVAVTGLRLVRDAVSGLMDEAPDEILGTLSSGLEAGRGPEWIDVHGLRVWRSGSFYHVDLHMVVPRYLDVDRLHDVDERVDETLYRALDAPAEVIVHFDPCRPRHCGSCEMADCEVRRSPFGQRTPWSQTRTTRVDEALDTGQPIARGRRA